MMNNYKTIHDAILADPEISARRSSWDTCRKIRLATESDRDFFPDEIKGLIVEDCKKQCDCKIGVWIVTNEDKKAEDWQAVDKSGNILTYFRPASKTIPESDMEQYRKDILSGVMK